MPNRLIHETSPYLRQHAHQPVDWYPWGEEAFRKARAEDKPIFLSIGYAACHWCHVMAHESFEDPDIAAILNRDFVPIKVDREERPDVDHIYMQAVQMMTGQGGWPLSVFLTPEGTPFYGGTYFPPEPRYGLPSFRQVLEAVREAWQTRREEIRYAAGQVAAQLHQVMTAKAPSPLSEDLLRNAYRILERDFDPLHGGFGNAPKFPQPMTLDLLLRLSRRFPQSRALFMVTFTLEKMARGGIYDHLGGGFHRYAVDAAWQIPHFEKMLYDNALLPRVYLRAWQVTGRADFLRIAEATIAFVLRELRHPQGPFFSSLDADSEGEEGKYYLWTAKDVDAVLEPEAATVVKAYYGIWPGGNFEGGRTVLHVERGLSEVAREVGRSPQEVARILERARQTLFAVRQKRVPPARDEKVLLGWNAMMVATLAEAARLLNRQDYLEAARRAMTFLLTHLRREDGRFLHTWKDGQARVPALLEDYAHLADALLRLYEATFEPSWLWQARDVAHDMLRLFWEPQARLFYDTGLDHEALVTRPRTLFDNAYPSGQAMASDVLWRLSRLLDDAAFARTAREVVESMADLMTRLPGALAHLLTVADAVLGPMYEVVLVEGEDDIMPLVQATFGVYQPNKVVALLPREPAPELAALPLMAGKIAVQGHSTAYVCQGYVCNTPVHTPEALRAQLAELTP